VLVVLLETRGEDLMDVILEEYHNRNFSAEILMKELMIASFSLDQRHQTIRLQLQCSGCSSEDFA
jgi:hypothetical protein